MGSPSPSERQTIQHCSVRLEPLLMPKLTQEPLLFVAGYLPSPNMTLLSAPIPTLTYAPLFNLSSTYTNLLDATSNGPTSSLQMTPAKPISALLDAAEAHSHRLNAMAREMALSNMLCVTDLTTAVIAIFTTLAALALISYFLCNIRIKLQVNHAPPPPPPSACTAQYIRIVTSPAALCRLYCNVRRCCMQFKVVSFVPCSSKLSFGTASFNLSTSDIECFGRRRPCHAACPALLWHLLICSSLLNVYAVD